jgi:anti-sigma-K factor RskA
MSDARQYLLGKLLAEDEARFEEALLEDGARHTEVDATAAELLDEYQADRLSPDERTAVEQRLLATPEGRFRLRASRALARKALAMPKPVRWRRWVLFAAPVLAAVAALLVLWLRPPGEVPPVELALVETTRASTLPEVTLGDARVLRLVLPIDATAIVVTGPAGFTSTPIATKPRVYELPSLAAGSYEVVATTAIGPVYFGFRVR